MKCRTTKCKYNTYGRCMCKTEVEIGENGVCSRMCVPSDQPISCMALFSDKRFSSEAKDGFIFDQKEVQKLSFDQLVTRAWQKVRGKKNLVLLVDKTCNELNAVLDACCRCGIGVEVQHISEY